MAMENATQKVRDCRIILETSVFYFTRDILNNFVIVYDCNVPTAGFYCDS